MNNSNVFVNKNLTLTITCGLPRSGKSTWVRSNCHNAVLVSNDWIRENILGAHYHKASHCILWTIMDTTLRIVLGQGKDAILDGCNHTAQVRKFWIDLAKECNAEVRIVLFKTPLLVCIDRNKDSYLPSSSLIKMDSEFEEPTPKEEYTTLEVIPYENQNH